MRERVTRKEWLGAIPKEWDYVPGRFVFKPRNSKGNKNEVLLAATQKQGMYPQHLLEGVVQVREGTDLQSFKTVHKNDYVISLRSFQGGFEMSDYEGVCSPAYQVFYNSKPISHRYYKYLFKSHGFIQEMDSVTVGIREGKNIPYNNFARTYIPYPPLPEQTRIASFLDDRCSKIDEAIARYRSIIEKLQNYKDSLIVNITTHGVSHNIMAPSSLSWVSENPSHWGIALLSQLYNPVKCKNTRLTERNLLSLSYGKIKQKDIENIEGLVPDNFEGYNIIERNDIVLRLTDLQNDQKSLRVGISTQRGIVTSAYITIRPKKQLCSKYFYYLLHSFDICKGFYGMGGGIRQGLNWDELKFMKVLLPSLGEQEEIVIYLDKISSSIDSAIERHIQLISKLEEYKKSLIYNAVTGKIEC